MLRIGSDKAEKNVEVVIIMETPFPKSISFKKKYSRLLEIVKPSDTLGILINADPDSMASAMTMPFYLDIGFTKTQVGAVVKIFGTGAVIGGSLAGGGADRDLQVGLDGPTR